MWRTFSAVRIIKQKIKSLNGEVILQEKQQNTNPRFIIYRIITQKNAFLEENPSRYNSTEHWSLKVFSICYQNYKGF
jgi:uncharacterized protein YfkK (UPF0435 family)